MRNLRKAAGVVVVLTGGLAATCAGPASELTRPSENGADASETVRRVRIALFNIREMKTAKILAQGDNGDDNQLEAAARIIRQVRPDVLVLNEIDHDYGALAKGEGLDLNARRFAESYLGVASDASDATGSPLDYPYAYAAPNNTGILTGLDLDGDGHASTDADRGERSHGDDCFGYGTYPGEYSMAVLSRYPILADEARTFQKLLWKDLPGHHIPPGFFSDEILDVFRLSSKSHWDVAIDVNGTKLHLFASHPTPIVFDGEEDKNGRRNFDEIKLWVDYLDGGESGDASGALYDDAGRRGGYESDEPFVVIGDLNASPTDTRSNYDGVPAIAQLLEHPRVQDSGPFLTSEGAVESREDGLAAGPPTYPERATAPFGDGIRIDYILPSTGLKILDGAVIWPSPSSQPEAAALAEAASDHHLLWLDLEL